MHLQQSSNFYKIAFIPEVHIVVPKKFQGSTKEQQPLPPPPVLPKKRTPQALGCLRSLKV